MQLITYKKNRDESHVGMLLGHRVLDINEGVKWLSTQDLRPAQPSLPPLRDMLHLIEQSDQYMPALSRLAEAHPAGQLSELLSAPTESVTLLAPLPRPTSLRDGYAFRQHVEASRRNRGVPMIPEFDHFPVFYFSNHMAITGPGKVPVQKKAQEKLDFELEVAIVLKKKGKNVSAAQADDMIFGYTIMNDWSARGLQMEEMKLNLGPAKGKDFATTIGPMIVTPDELEKYKISGPSGNRYNLKMKAFINGKQLSEGNLKDMNWTFAQIIERASYGVTLHPGDLIGSGTVGTGCLMELNGSKVTDNLWIKPGDEVTLEVEGLGRLVNQITDGGP